MFLSLYIHRTCIDLDLFKILALNHPKTQFKCGILLDPWTQPLVMMDRLCTIYRPVLAILSEQFAFWPDNFDTLQELMQSSPCSHRSVCFSLTGTAHTHQSDVMVSIIMTPCYKTLIMFLACTSTSYTI